MFQNCMQRKNLQTPAGDSHGPGKSDWSCCFASLKSPQTHFCKHCRNRNACLRKTTFGQGSSDDGMTQWSTKRRLSSCKSLNDLTYLKDRFLTLAHSLEQFASNALLLWFFSLFQNCHQDSSELSFSQPYLSLTICEWEWVIECVCVCVCVWGGGGGGYVFMVLLQSALRSLPVSVCLFHYLSGVFMVFLQNALTPPLPPPPRCVCVCFIVLNLLQW